MIENTMAINFSEMRRAVSDGLRRERWFVCGTPMDFSFVSTKHSDFRQVSSQDIVGASLPDAWIGCWVFGRYDFANGGGASPLIAIREADGFVCGLDMERQDRTIFYFNSSLDQFIRTFDLLGKHFRISETITPEVVLQARALDPNLFDESEWRNFCEC